jgi:hypothetical protein
MAMMRLGSKPASVSDATRSRAKGRETPRAGAAEELNLRPMVSVGVRMLCHASAGLDLAVSRLTARSIISRSMLGCTIRPRTTWSLATWMTFELGSDPPAFADERLVRRSHGAAVAAAAVTARNSLRFIEWRPVRVDRRDLDLYIGMCVANFQGETDGCIS